ncbi:MULTISPECIES: hypothetical protein [Bradyrhizobium]|uniref:hypothetical protein n=1 Tax=Bradyrhizobium TaxID=374 RepID=UPI000D387FBB|nr:MULTISPECIES: hypothetical protein [Bradyrhizobium]WOH52726.1 hypothetical protein RX328_11700 [Bradyrhizobium sp. sBnM-33]
MADPNCKTLVVDRVVENRDLLARRLHRLGFRLSDQIEDSIIRGLAAIAERYKLFRLHKTRASQSFGKLLSRGGAVGAMAPE